MISLDRKKRGKLGLEAAPSFHKAAASPLSVRHTPFSVETRQSGDCLSPVTVWAASAFVLKADNKTREPGLEISRLVRCRKCKNCLERNARHWAARACSEAEHSLESQRIWAVTLTMSVEEHLRHAYSAGVDLDDAGAMVRVEGEALKKAFKRLRGWLGAQARYLAVAELHKSGVPHWHMLVHEPVGQTITKRMLSGDPDEGLQSMFWPHGHVHARLCDPDDLNRAVWYACKYLTKDHQARTRASLGYGKGPPSLRVAL